MADTAVPQFQSGVITEPEQKNQSKTRPDSGFLVVCWNDPVNTFEYVTFVFQNVFGWPKNKARFHMLQVHQEGKSVLTRESMEKAEHYVHQLRKHTLQATMEREDC